MSDLRTGKIKITKFHPIGTKILVLPEEEPEELKSKGGIILTGETPDTIKREVRGKVIDIGEKVSEVKIGDIVVYKKMFELSITVADVRHVILDLGIGKEHVIGIQTE